MKIEKNSLSPIAIVAPPGGRELAQLVDKELTQRRYPKNREKSFIIRCECPRFANGEAKAVILQSIRGYDVYVIADIGNYGCRFTIQGIESPMSPDDHFQDIKRVVASIGGRAYRINVIMPLLYQSRQHKRTARESLDCAVALQELQNLGVKNLITFDAHNSHVQNAVPLMGFENLHASYQIVRSLLENEKEIIVDKNKLMVVSPDEGAVDRCLYYANSLGVELGLFYKRRDTTRIVDGMLASGQSMLMSAEELKKYGANDIYVIVTFALLTDEGVERFEKAYNEKLIKRVYATNLTYRNPKLKNAKWFREVDVSEFIAYFIDRFNRDESISALLDTSSKIHKFLKKH